MKKKTALTIIAQKSYVTQSANICMPLINNVVSLERGDSERVEMSIIIPGLEKFETEVCFGDL